MGTTYPLQPNRIVETIPEWETRIVSFSDFGGSEQRISTRTKPKHTFRLIHQYISKSELDLIINFFNEKKGAFYPFYFVNHIDNKTYTVRFKNDSLKIDHINAKFFNVELELIETNGSV